jgi:CRISPR-associated protein Cas1
VSHRVVSVSGPAWVRNADRHVVIERQGAEIGRVPLEDMAALLLDGPDLAVTHTLLGACADAGVAVVTADERHLPNGVLLSLHGHSLHTAVFRQQLECPRPAIKRAWQVTVRAKIEAQALVLARRGADPAPLRQLTSFVRSGDPDNVEATAAARYFALAFGPDFVRERETTGLNAMLNYGYAVLRSAVARAIVGAGLHPALGIHHRNQYNPLCLADDAMEPLRPAVDWIVLRLHEAHPDLEDLTPPIKRQLVEVLGTFVEWNGQRLSLFPGLERYAASLRRALCEGEGLEVPRPVLPP